MHRRQITLLRWPYGFGEHDTCFFINSFYNSELHQCIIKRVYILLPHPFSLLCGVDVSYEAPAFNSVLRVLP